MATGLSHAAHVALADVHALVASLAGHAPQYRVPAVSLGHTRHYMPQFKSAAVLVLDAFVALDPQAPLYVWWPDVTLEPAQEVALDAILERLGYLGRAESWVVASRVPPEAAGDLVANVRVLTAGEEPAPGEEIARLLVARAPEEYQGWREGYLAQIPEDDSESSVRRRRPVPVPPVEVFEALRTDTATLRLEGWHAPPAGRWLSYARPALPAPAVMVHGPSSAPTGGSAPVPAVARYAVVGPERPRLVAAMVTGERVRRALVALGGPQPVFTGKDPGGRPMLGHQHASFYCEALGGGDQISHITVHAPMGLDGAACQALGQLRELGVGEGRRVQLVLLGLGQVADFAVQEPDSAVGPILARGTRWSSLTPFVPTRHPRRTRSERLSPIPSESNGPGAAEEDLRRLLALSGRPEPKQVRALEGGLVLPGAIIPWHAFQTRRPGGESRRGAGRGQGFELVFDSPVRGPIALGYGAHLGLGLFLALDVLEP